MKKLMMLLLMIILTINLLLGCGNDGSAKMNIKEVKTIASFDELDEIPKGDLGFSNFLFINETTTLQNIIDKNGQPDAMFGSNMNIHIWYYKLADGGLFSFDDSPYADSALNISYISYGDVTILLYAPQEVKDNIDLYFNTAETRVVFFQDAK